MKEIKISVVDKVASAVGSPVIVCGNSNYKITFTFDNEWGAYQEKTARFTFIRDGILKYIDVLFSGSSCTVPILSNIERVSIGVYAGDLRTTTGAEIRCRKSILCLGGLKHELPPEDVYNQILETVSKKLGSEGGTVTGDYFKDGNTFIHEGNLDLLDNHIGELTEVTATAIGKAITIESANAPLQSLKLYGKTTQDGTPTPTSPIELKSVGDSGSFEVGVYGKNVLEIRDADTTNEGITYTVNKEEGYIEVNGTATAFSHTLVSMNTANLPEGSYVLSGCPYSYSSSCVLYSNGNEKYDVGNGVNIEVTKDNPILNIVLAVYEGATVNNLRVYPMLRLATETDNTYKPYNKQSLTNNDTLRDIGGIKDERDFAKGVKIQRIEKGKVSSEYKACIDLPNGSKGLLVSLARKVKRYNAGLMSTHAKFDNSQTCAENTVYENDVNIVFCGNATDTYETLVSKFGEAIFYYILETPIETPLSETELNAYRQLMTNKDTTTILSEANMEVDYYVNKPNAQAIGNIHSQMNKDYFKLQQAIIETGGN